MHVFSSILEKRDFDWGGPKWLSGGGHHGGWGGFAPPQLYS